MIRRNPSIPDNILELERHESIGDYARAYGDKIARAYEDLNLIYIPFFPLDIDLPFWRAITMPAPMKKVGTHSGIEKSIFVRNGDKILFDESHILLKAAGTQALAGYMHGQIAHVNGQIRSALIALFPRYFSLFEESITWRLTPTGREGLHIDTIGRGTPAPQSVRQRYRLKLFLNIDSEPRKWRTSLTIPEILIRYRGALPAALPADADLIGYKINTSRFTSEMPSHEIDIPPMGAVMAEAGTLVHEVVQGNRMIAAEFFCEASDMLDPAKNAFAAAPQWLADAGIAIDPSGVLSDVPA